MTKSDIQLSNNSTQTSNMEYDIDISNKTYIIKISSDDERGFFEHRRLSTTGSLFFEQQTLVDFDGVEYLPLDVIQQLARSGYDIEGFA